VIDVGGGRGRLIATILAEHKHLCGILFDQPHVIESARETLDEAGVFAPAEPFEAPTMAGQRQPLLSWDFIV
jgi:hypothetical protein